MIDEADILKKLPSLLPLTRRIAAGAGDDCAVITMPGDNDLLAAADQVIENIHFLPETPPYDAGKKLMNRTLSDIAAMGGTPLTALLTIAVNGKSMQWVTDFLKGAADAGMRYNVPVCGGDTAKLPAPGAVATLTILGEVPKGKSILRSGAEPGDLLYITGPVGNSFKSNHHLHFTPRLAESRLIAPFATAMIDISDGLLLDAARIAESSSVTLLLDLEQIPLRPGAEKPQAFSDGEDYELLFTSPHLPETFCFPDTGKITCIGKVVPAQGDALLTADHQPIKMEYLGYVHR